MLAVIAAYAGAWADRFGNGTIIFIGGLLISAGYLLASFSTQLWQLYLTQGLLAGAGYSLSFISAVSVIGQWFDRHRGLAIGIAVSGSGLGQFAVSLITIVLITNNGWRVTLRYLALMSIVGLTICGFFIRRRLPLVVHKKNESSSSSSIVYFKNRNFRILYAGGFISTLGYVMPFTYLPQYAIQQGISTSNAVWLLSIMGICSATGRVALGFAADRLGQLPMLRFCIFVGGVSTLCWMACTTMATISVYAAVFGFFSGGLISLMPAVTAKLFGIDKLGEVIGLLYTSQALGNLLSAPIAGYLYAARKSYYPPIAVAGSFMLIGAFLTCLIVDNSKYVHIPDKHLHHELQMSAVKQLRDLAEEEKETKHDVVFPTTLNTPTSSPGGDIEINSRGILKDDDIELNRSSIRF
jgi:MFS family permease